MRVVRRIVSNRGPLISLEKLRQGYDFIRQLYDTIIIPPGVLDEVAEGQFATPHAYLQHYGIVDLIEVQAVLQSEQLPEAVPPAFPNRWSRNACTGKPLRHNLPSS